MSRLRRWGFLGKSLAPEKALVGKSLARKRPCSEKASLRAVKTLPDSGLEALRSGWDGRGLGRNGAGLFGAGADFGYALLPN